MDSSRYSRGLTTCRSTVSNSVIMLVLKTDSGSGRSQTSNCHRTVSTCYVLYCLASTEDRHLTKAYNNPDINSTAFSTCLSLTWIYKHVCCLHVPPQCHRLVLKLSSALSSSHMFFSQLFQMTMSLYTEIGNNVKEHV